MFSKSTYQSLNVIEIKQSHIENNLKVIQELQPTHTIIPVVKSNAYGHGLEQITKILSNIRSVRIPLIAVDSYPEYQIVRATTQIPILVFWETLAKNYSLYNNKHTHIAVGSMITLQWLIDTQKKWNIHLFLNTGMNREGVQYEELQPILDILSQHKKITVIGVMSHLVNADLQEDTFTEQQITTFKKMYDYIHSYGHNPKYIHISNSAWLVKIKDPLFTASRSWLAIYGYNPLEKNDPQYHKYHDLQPALRLTSTVTALQHLEPEEWVSYGLTWNTKKKTTIATLPIGYHEWLPRKAGEWYIVYKDNHWFPIRGRVCMNLSCIEIGKKTIKIGDSVEIIGRDKKKKNTIEELNTINKAISYTNLISLHSNIKRIIV